MSYQVSDAVPVRRVGCGDPWRLCVIAGPTRDLRGRLGRSVGRAGGDPVNGGLKLTTAGSVGSTKGEGGNEATLPRLKPAVSPQRRRIAREVSDPTVSIVIPAKNEERNLPLVLPALPDGLHEVILVDGNSTDNTVQVAQELCPEIIVIGQTRKGKGNALACGFAASTGDFIVMLDADGSTDPAEIPRFVDALKHGADFAKGSRFMAGAGSSDISRLRQRGNWGLSKIVNLLYGTRYTDLCYGYNAFRRGCLTAINLDPSVTEYDDPNVMQWGDGFEVETLINLRVAKAGLRVFEVPSFERNRYFGSSNLNALSDGLRVLRTIHTELKRGSRRLAVEGQAVSRSAGEMWSVLSTVEDEAI